MNACQVIQSNITVHCGVQEKFYRYPKESHRKIPRGRV